MSVKELLAKGAEVVGSVMYHKHVEIGRYHAGQFVPNNKAMALLQAEEKPAAPAPAAAPAAPKPAAKTAKKKEQSTPAPAPAVEPTPPAGAADDLLNDLKDL